MIACPSCATAVAEEAAFCPVCGGHLPPAAQRRDPAAPIVADPGTAPAPPRCPSCGTTSESAGARFCGRCGALLTPPFTPVATGALPPPPAGWRSEPGTVPAAPLHRGAGGGRRVAPSGSDRVGKAVVVAAVVTGLVLLWGLIRLGAATVDDGGDAVLGAGTTSTTEAPPEESERTPSTGEVELVERWRAPLDSGVVEAPAAGGGVVVVADQAGRVRALDAVTGAPRWQVEVGAGIGAAPITANDVVLIPTVVGGSPSTGVLHALDLATGAERWRFAIDQGLQTRPAVAGGRVYVASGSLYALDLVTGGALWTSELAGAVHEVAADVGSVYAAGAGTVVSLDALTGALRWQMTLATGLLRPLPVGDVVVVPDQDGGLHGLETASGDVRWSMDGPGGATGALGILDGGEGLVQVGDRDGSVHGIEVARGVPVWRVGAFASLPAGSGWGDHLLVAGGDVVALEPVSGRVQGELRFDDGFALGGDAGMAVDELGAYVIVLDAGGTALVALDVHG